MKCTKCAHENPQGEMFCEKCGEELKPAQAAPSPAPATQTVAPTPQTTPVPSQKPSGKKIATLKVGADEFDLTEGAIMLVARADSDKCTPEIALNDPTVSSTPLQIVGNSDGTVTVEDTGTSTGFRVVTLYKPGEKAILKIGDMLMIGKQLIIVE